MNDMSLRPLKKHTSFSPVLLELTIIILFFALSTGVVVQLIAAASSISGESAYHSRALLAMETVAEQVKADPEGGGFGADGVRAFSDAVDEDLTVEGTVTRDLSPAGGTLYQIDLYVLSENGTRYSLSAARYVSDAEVTP